MNKFAFKLHGYIVYFCVKSIVSPTKQSSHSIDNPHRFALSVIRNPDLLEDIFHRKLEGDDLIVD